MRFDSLKDALQRSDIKGIICVRGGYGSMLLVPHLESLRTVVEPKLFLGMSDITALNLYLMQKWQWPVVHGSLAMDKFSPESITATQKLIFGNSSQLLFQGTPLNDASLNPNATIKAELTGGNLCLVQASIGTAWQLDARNKIIFLEEVSERGYKIDRMLAHLRQAKIFENAVGIVLGDFTGGDEPDGSNLVSAVLKRFAAECSIPVVRIKGVGHDYTSLPLPLGISANLSLGNVVSLEFNMT